MTNSFDHSDEENGLNAEDLKFFKKRAKFLSLSEFAQTDLTLANKKSKKDKRNNPSAFDALEAAEDAQATAFKKMQSSMQKIKNEESDDESEEDEFDRMAKKSQAKRELNEIDGQEPGLPIRSAAGEWKRQAGVKVVAPKKTKADSDSDEMSKTIPSTILSSSNSESVDEIASPTASLDEVKEQLALLAMEITENVEENIGKLKELLKYTRPGLRKNCPRAEESELVQIGLITAVAVFKDILPGYSIRPLTEVERQAKVGKDVKKQRYFEETLLRSYGQFIDRLEEILKTVKRGDAGIVPIAVGCLGELAVEAGHFNFYERILSALCGQIFNGKELISSVAISAVEKVFTEDEIGRSTGHALRLISDAIQARDYLPEPRCLKVLQQVRIKLLAFSRTDALPSEKRIASEEAVRLDVYKKKSLHMSKSQKKNLKTELAESVKSARSEAEFSREEKSKWSSDALKFLFRILFGILKRFTNNDDHNSSNTQAHAIVLLPEVMKCLSKCAQFLSVEYFGDLLNTLKKIINLIENGQSITATLHTIQTILQINSLQESSRVDILKGTGTGSSSCLDMKFYYDLVYRQLLNISDWSREFENLFENVIAKLFFSKKHCPPVRVASFIHRFANLIENESTSSIGLTDEAKLYFLKLIVRLMERNEKARGLLDEETLGVAAYLPNCPDPDLCNPFCKQLNLDRLVKSLKEKNIHVNNELINQIRRIKLLQ